MKSSHERVANWQSKETRPVMGGGTSSGKHCDLCSAGPLRFMEQYLDQGKTLCLTCYKKESTWPNNLKIYS
jgi:hypothetical protein